MNEITVLLPAYNEEGNIETLIRKWQSYKLILQRDYQLILKLIIVNDGSQDHTQNIAECLSIEYDNIFLINHKQNQGLGAALKTGLEYILEYCKESQYVCVMDCDNTHDPKYVLDMLQKQRDTYADVIIASRYQKGASIQGLSKLRRLTCQAAKSVYGTSLHVKGVRDYTCGYRLYTKKILARLKFQFEEKMIEEKGFACMTEILYKLYACGAHFKEIPFELRYDFKEGASKMKIVKTSFNSMKLVMKLRRIKK